jgi:hypothetical protein
MRQPLPDREILANQAETVAKQLAKWLEQLDPNRFSAEAAQKLRRELTAPDSKRVYDWDAQVQRYLALVAIVPSLKEGKLSPEIAKLYQRLQQAFPMKPPRYDSPKDYRPSAKFP